jgi:hypothetical protein
VVAHLALGRRLSRRAAILGILHARGSINRMIGDGTRRLGAGGGPEVREPAAELLLAATRRPAGLSALSGPGRDEAAARLT